MGTFQEISMEGHWKFQGGWGAGFKANVFKRMYEGNK